MAAGTKIGEILLQHGLINIEQLNRALTMHRRSGARLGVCLVRLGYVDEDTLARALGGQLGIPVAAPAALDDVPQHVIERVPRQVARAHNLVPIAVEGREVHVCLADPQNLIRLDEIAFTLGCRIRPFLATELAIERALARYYGDGPDVWEGALGGTAEWRVERTGSWRMPLLQSPPPLVVVEGELARPEPPLPETPPPAPSIPDDPYERLAAVQSRPELVAAMAHFFARHFGQLCITEVVAGGVRCVAVRSDGTVTLPPAGPLVSVEGATWLRELLAHPQIIVRQSVSDPNLRALLEGLGLPATAVAVVPVFDYGRLCYVLLGIGLGADEVKQVFGELKPYLTALSEALRMMGLREHIRKRARRRPA